ncbi:MAG: SRPBCC domain-containing protein [Planctomyces sp.]|nr:SRPBCC domain-containing protein [Planctomyces sp.]
MIRFAFRWHPFAIDPNHDDSSEMKSLVSFELAEVDGGTQLTITESGFDQIPVERRSQAYKANYEGWTRQSRLLATYLSHRGNDCVPPRHL